MASIVKIKKGLDIPLPGTDYAAEAVHVSPRFVAVCPDDFPGYTWKPCVTAGDKVSIGSPIMRAKENPVLCLVSPAAGTVAALRRGERRHLLAIEIECDRDRGLASSAATFEPTSERDSLIKLLCESGMWAYMRQRPFGVVPDPAVIPRDIFVSAFDSAPGAPDMNIGMTSGEMECLERGLEALRSLTQGIVHLGVPTGSSITSHAAQVTEYDGPHPSGLPSTQIAAIAPLAKGQVVWTLEADTVRRIGYLLVHGRIYTDTVVAVGGPACKSPRLVVSRVGARISDLLAASDDRVSSAGVRIISGDPLTGVRVDASGFLHYPYRQITLLEEGDTAEEFLGWASMNPRKYSVKPSFPSWIGRRLGRLHFDARLLGGRRAPILSGEIDKVMPLDIYPEFLLRAMEAGDIEGMESLGALEVVPEDFALAEFVDTSKRPLQDIVRRALTALRKETM